jgi:hypothetical protein
MLAIAGVFMSNLQQLLDQADRKFERGAFAEARDDYRAACLIAPPSLELLTNLNQAEKYEQLAFRRVLQDMYPISVEIGLRVAQLLKSSEAIECYSELLKIPNLTVRDQIDVRLHRFAALCGARKSSPLSQEVREALMFEDLDSIWALSEENSSYSRMSLLNTISREMSEPSNISFLEKLLQARQLREEFRVFLEAKANELRTLVKAQEVFDDLPTEML